MSGVNLSSRLWVGGSLPWKPSCLPPLMSCVCRRSLSAAAPFPKALLGSTDTFSSCHRPGLQLLCLPLRYPLPFGYAQIQEPRHITKIQSLSKQWLDKEASCVLHSGGRDPCNTGFCFMFASMTTAEFLTGFYSTLPGRSSTSRKAFLVQHQQKLVAWEQLFVIKQSCSIPPKNALILFHHSFLHHHLLPTGQAFFQCSFHITFHILMQQAFF